MRLSDLAHLAILADENVLLYLNINVQTVIKFKLKILTLFIFISYLGITMFSSATNGMADHVLSTLQYASTVFKLFEWS